MKYEYFGYKFIEHKELDTLAYRMDMFNEYGSKGWELVSVDNGIAYFKRPIPDEIPIYRDGVKLDLKGDD